MGNTAKKGLIIAAGRGMRLNEHSREIPKCLIQIGGTRILDIILAALHGAGITETVIVVGYKHERIREAVGETGPGGMRISYVHNPDWQRQNGVSVLAARNVFAPDEPFLLMMSDHLFDARILARLQSAPKSPEELLLCTDRDINRIFDIDDAMKVVQEDDRIIEIGKSLRRYNAIDCGLFKATGSLFDALESAAGGGDCSLSDGCRFLIRAGRMRSVDIGGARWLDVDTPEALAHAKTFVS